MDLSLTLNRLTFRQLDAVTAALQQIKFEEVAEAVLPLMQNRVEHSNEIEVDASTAVPAGDVADVDDHGVPWHASYHAETKGRNNDGSWKRRRGCDKAAAAEYERRFHSMDSVKPAQPTNVESLALHRAASAPLPVFGGLPPFAPLPPVEPAPSYNELYNFFQTLSQTGKIGLEQLTAILKEHGIQDAGVLQTDENGRRSVMESLKRLAA